MTRTFFTSTRFLAPAIAPLFRYACAFGASCVLFHLAERCVKVRSWRSAAGESLLPRREVNGLAVRDVKLRAVVEGAMERNGLVSAGARRARREQRAIAGGQAAESFELKKTTRCEIAGAEAGSLKDCKTQWKAARARAQHSSVPVTPSRIID
jgi:hypothetical protein